MLVYWITLSCFTSLVLGAGRYGPLLARQTSAGNTTSFVKAYNFSMPVDHFNASDNRVYNNRYWISDQYYQQGGPVVWYDFGESGVGDEYPSLFLGEVNDTIVSAVEIAKRFNGMLVVWEHRYYGLSLPVPFNGTDGYDPNFFYDTGLPVEGPAGYKYLNVEQALEDIAYFAKNFKLEGYNDTASVMLRPSTTPWIGIGGSYPGSRMAWSRLRNPEVFYAVWSSSAPVQTREDMGVYWNPVYRSMPENCSSDIHAVIQYVDGILSSTDTTLMAYLQEQIFSASSFQYDNTTVFNASSTDDIDYFQIASSLLQPMLVGFQNYGPARTTDILCNYMQTYNPKAQTPTPSPYDADADWTSYMLSVIYNPDNATAEDSGIVSRYGPDVGLNAYLYGGTRFEAEFLQNLTTYSTIVNQPPTFTTDMHSWRWQTLFEIGGFYVSSPGKSYNIISKFFNVSSYEEEQIDTLFSVYNPDVFPPHPAVDSLLRYGGWDMRPSNVMFTDGEFDPWGTCSVMSIEESIGAPLRKVVQDIPKCGQPPEGTDVFGIVYPGEAHVPDLIRDLVYEPVDGGPVKVGVDLFSQALEQWLPCFPGWSDFSANALR